MAYQIEVLGLKDLEKNLKAIAKIIGGNELADSLAKGAMEIVWEAQKNVMAQGLYDTMALWKSIHPKKVNQYRVDVEVGNDKVVYGAVHEFGLPNQPITDKQRRFFWAMYAKTKDTMWKALALSTTYTIPARPYLRPAIDTQKRAALTTVAQSLGGKFAHVVK
jgi:phage gpG-like protein